jgi:predicted metalloenzyme YecM
MENEEEGWNYLELVKPFQVQRSNRRYATMDKIDILAKKQVSILVQRNSEFG